jgi:hypothetical protein
MSVFFSPAPGPDDPELAELWQLLENEYFEDALSLARSACENPQAAIEFFCGLSLAYGESTHYAEAESVARYAVGFGEGHWSARYALATALLHQGRFMASLDSLGFYRTPDQIYVIRAQVEKMGGYTDSLRMTLEDALEKIVPPAIHLYLAYLHGAFAESLPEWSDSSYEFEEVRRFGKHVDVWERDAARHAGSSYAIHLNQHIQAIHTLLAARD